MSEYVTTHGEALRQAKYALTNHLKTLTKDYDTGYFRGGSRTILGEVIKNYKEALAIIESDLIPEEEKWERENGFRLGDRFYPDGNAPEEDE